MQIACDNCSPRPLTGFSFGIDDIPSNKPANGGPPFTGFDGALDPDAFELLSPVTFISFAKTWN